MFCFSFLLSFLHFSSCFLNWFTMKHLFFGPWLKNSKFFLPTSPNKYFGALINNNFRTLVGGCPYYDLRSNKNSILENCHRISTYASAVKSMMVFSLFFQQGDGIPKFIGKFAKHIIFTRKNSYFLRFCPDGPIKMPHN